MEKNQEMEKKENSTWIVVFLIIGIASFFLTFKLMVKKMLPVLPFEDGGAVLYFMLVSLVITCLLYGFLWIAASIFKIIR